MVKGSLLSGAVLSLAFLPQGLAHSGDDCFTVSRDVEPRLSAGEGNGVDVDVYQDNDGNEVPDAFSADDDFSGHCHREVKVNNLKYSGDNTLNQIIWPHATQNGGKGQVSVIRAFYAQSGDKYWARGRLNLWGWNGQASFKGAIRVSAWKSPDEPVLTSSGAPWERAKFMCMTAVEAPCDLLDDDTWQNMTLGPINMPSGTTVGKVALRAHRDGSTAGGTVGFDRVQFWRVD